MAARRTISTVIAGTMLLAAVELVAFAAVSVPFATQAQAQRMDDRFPFFGGGASRQQRPRSGGGFFRGLFGPFESGPRPDEQQQAPQDYSRAPAPKKTDTTPTISVAVIGDAMADWLAYGLEDTFSDSPEIGIVRKNRARSGLIRYEPRSDLDWPHVARDFLAKEKVDYIVVMLGVSDRQAIRETDAEREAEQKENEQSQPDSADQPAPEPARKGAKGSVEFRSPRWEAIYVKRIDDMIAAAKSKGVPVFWVGLPAIRGTKSTADTVYLNDLYRARAQKAGVIYVDVWDGFVDDAGKFAMHGPDYEGQTRRLRSFDGVYFTTYGAIKLAHYVDRELQRVMANRMTPVALPASGPIGPQAPAQRPLAGPVVPLNAIGNAGELLGGSANHPANTDPTANRVLVKGEPVTAPPGRADDFTWPRGSDANAKAVDTPIAAAPAAEPAKAEPRKVEPPKAATAKVEPATPAPATHGKKPAAAPAPKVTQNSQARPKTAPQAPAAQQPRPPVHRNNAPPRPPAPINPFNSLFGR
ncbi:MAG TPA: SGNH family hydrolase [Pseudolabrys sp.]|nr:SGNH family hydrolase [Pseudolabrys sp.]